MLFLQIFVGEDGHDHGVFDSILKTQRSCPGMDSAEKNRGL